MSAALFGAGLSGLGIGMNAIGQMQAGNAQQRALANSAAIQAIFDEQMRARVQQLLQGITPGVIAPDAYAKAQAPLDASARNAAGSVAAVAGRKTGGARGTATARASAAGANAGSLAQAIQANRLAAIQQALGQNAQNFQNLFNDFSGDAARIRGDAQAFANLLPLHLQAAGRKGQYFRMGGQALGAGGMGLMNYAFSQPANNQANRGIPTFDMSEPGASDLQPNYDNPTV